MLAPMSAKHPMSALAVLSSLTKHDCPRKQRANLIVKMQLIIVKGLFLRIFRFSYLDPISKSTRLVQIRPIFAKLLCVAQGLGGLMFRRLDRNPCRNSEY